MSVEIDEALKIITENVQPTHQRILPIENAVGYVLHETLYASQNLPPYDNAAMDGFAVCMEDAGSTVEIIDTVLAGDHKNSAIENGQCVRIMTGAKVPQNCTAIVPIEEVSPSGNHVPLPQSIKMNKHIRFCGEDIKVGEKVLTGGTLLNAYHIGVLASQGITHVSVYKKPSVALFASGNELREHHESVDEFQLYNTNTPTLFARIESLGYNVDFLGTCEDTPEALISMIEQCSSYDLIVTTGGISVGDADFTKTAFEKAGFTPLFEKVDIKPGKPTTFGKVGKSYVLNLPGNPLAAMLNFELFGKSILLCLSGTTSKYMSPMETVMAETFILKGTKDTLVPGFYNGSSFKHVHKFSPGMVSPLALCNGFLLAERSLTELPANKPVRFIPFDTCTSSQIKKDLYTR